MPHKIVLDAESILDRKFDVLDKGFVRLIDYMGDDARICEAARVSYAEGTKSISDNKGLISYLMRNQHTSPFEKVIFEFHIKLPIFVARQFIRHRTARVSEVSGRYSVMKNEFYIPRKENIRKQSKTNKQGSGDRLDTIDELNTLSNIEGATKRAYEVYEYSINMGISRETARIILPLNLYTEWYWQIDLHNLMNFLKLRLDSHAQYEIRQYAEMIANIVEHVCPMTMDAFLEHILHGVHFSQTQTENLKRIFIAAKLEHGAGYYGLSVDDYEDLQKKLGVE
jgi:thymidylate synthase (FAD)